MLIVWKLDHLGRSLRDLITLLDDLKARDVACRSLTEAIDTTIPTGRAMWHMVGILAELERSLIQERTTARPCPCLLEQERVAHVAPLFNVSRQTVERALRNLDAQAASMRQIPTRYPASPGGDR